MTEATGGKPETTAISPNQRGRIGQLPDQSIWDTQSTQQSPQEQATGPDVGKNLEKAQDSSLIDLPKGVAISTGPYTQDGIYIIGAPQNSAFRFDQTRPEVEGRLISRHGKLWAKDDQGNLVEPPDHLRAYGWITTRKTHRLLPKHFKGADSAKLLPNFKVEEWVIE